MNFHSDYRGTLEQTALDECLSYAQVGTVCVARILTIILDKRASEQLRGPAVDLAASTQQLIVDLSPVRYLDVFGFEMLLELIHRCPGRAALAGIDASIESMFLLSQLATSLELYSTVPAAIHAFNHSSTDG